MERFIPVLASGCNDGGCSLAEFSATAQNFVVRFSLDERTESGFHITKHIMIQLAVVAEKRGADRLFDSVIWGSLHILHMKFES
jgi:hypothetical protein